MIGSIEADRITILISTFCGSLPMVGRLKADRGSRIFSAGGNETDTDIADVKHPSRGEQIRHWSEWGHTVWMIKCEKGAGQVGQFLPRHALSSPPNGEWAWNN